MIAGGRQMSFGTQRVHLNFRGRVQGVGFRYSAYKAAGSAGVTGWVRNEYDGSVTMELQGSPAQIDKTIQLLENERYIRIDRIERREIPLDPKERRFRVRY